VRLRLLKRFDFDAVSAMRIAFWNLSRFARAGGLADLCPRAALFPDVNAPPAAG